MQNIIQFFLSGANRVRTGYTLAFFLLLISLGLTLFSVNRLSNRANAVDRTNLVILNLERLMGNIKDAETGVRGYLLMKSPYFLEPYLGSRGKADSVFAVVQDLVADNIVQINNANKVKVMMHARYSILSKGLEIFNRNGNQFTDSLKPILLSGKETMDSIRSIIKTMQVHEQGLLMRHTAQMDATRSTTQTINITSLVLSILLAFYSFFTFNKENKARRQADIQAAGFFKNMEAKIEDLKKANAELVRLRRNEKFAVTGRIARTIAHEVRNPLTNINLAAEQLKDDLEPEKEDQHLLLDMINRNSTRINQLVTDLLESTRFIELHYEKHSINNLLDEALELAADRLELNHIAVVKSYADDVCDVEVDAEKIKIAFLNIIVNAIEAMEPGKGVLTITTVGEMEQCVTYIKDNGTGMDEEAQQNLFEPYFTSKPSGNGLGMTNTQKIILNHNGSINVESSPGKGTTFIIGLGFPPNH